MYSSYFFQWRAHDREHITERAQTEADAPWLSLAIPCRIESSSRTSRSSTHSSNLFGAAILQVKFAALANFCQRDDSLLV